MEGFMKKKLVFTVFLIVNLVIGSFLLADEPSSGLEIVPKLSLGGGTFFAHYISGGGFADFSFLLFNKNHLDLRNHFVLRGAALGDAGGLLTFSEKLSFGGLVFKKFRSYGYVEGGIGLWGNDNKKLFGMPLAYSFGGGGGTDIFLGERNSIFFETGCLINILDKEWKSGGVFQIGWKGYF
jgi:hypothetical protein